MSVYERTQEQEMALAYGQKRQPSCMYCKHLLDEVRQYQDETVVFPTPMNPVSTMFFILAYPFPLAAFRSSSGK